MIEIVSVEVRNFRSFTDAQFAPLGAGQGVTAVNGPNGVGKSSIATHALLWALYGVTPDGVPVKALRRHDSEGDVVARVVFRHDGQTIEVTRALRGKKDTTTAAITVDGVEQTNVSSRTATAWVTDRLRVNAEAFSTAFVVRQKELDALVRARPAERRAVVERLAGIDRMSEALTRAREDARRKKTAADAIPITVPVSEARVALQEAEAQHAEAASLVAECHDKQSSAQASAKQTAATVQELTDTREEWLRAATAAQNAQQAHSQSLREHQQTLTAATGADTLPDLQAALADVRQHRSDLQEIINAAVIAHEATQAAGKAVESASERLQRHQQTLTATQTAVQDAETVTAHTSQEDIEAKVREATKREQGAREQVGAASAEATRLTEALKSLSAHDTDTHTCPTCQNVLTDVEGLRSLLTDQQEAARQRHAQATRNLADATDALQRAREAQTQYATAVNALQRARDSLTAAQAAAREAQEDLRTAQRDAGERQRQWETLRADAEEAESEIAALVDEEQAVSTALRKAETAAEAAERLPSTQAAITQTETLAQEADAMLAGCTEVTDSELAAAQTAADEAARVLQDARHALTRAEASEQIASAALNNARAVYATAEQNETVKQHALQDAEKAWAVASALEEFRRDRVARLAPELSETASDLLQIMTEGRFSSVELDEDFTPIVTEAATGHDRPVAWLSGGEESAVALALRLAIGEVVSGQKVGLLVLDEVLTAQDTSRRAAVMGAIRSIPHRQIIMINHVSEATDMVDLVAHIDRDPDGAVTIRHETPTPAGQHEVTLIDA